MSVDPSVLPGLVIVALAFLALAAFGFVVARVALGQTDDRMALAQGLVIGPALWGLLVNFVLHLLPGLAGAVVGWTIMLALGVGLAWRVPSVLRLRRRTVAGFAAATLAVYWIALASRQLLSIPDEDIHLAIAATIRAGQFPPVLSWIPDLPLPYHYGADLLIGLLTPPVGPDLAFTTELLGAYIWTGFVLVIATAVLRHGGTSTLVLVPLLLTAGAWTLVWYANAPDILRIPVPSGIPAAGIRASVSNTYWPSAALPWAWPGEASPPNIWKPPFVMAYALAFVVLERAAAASAGAGWRTWPLALLIGFMGLIAEEVALLVLAFWGVLEVVRFLRSRSARPTSPRGSAAGVGWSSAGCASPGHRGRSPNECVDRRRRKRSLTWMARGRREPAAAGRPRRNAWRSWRPRPRRCTGRCGGRAPRPAQSIRPGARVWKRSVSHCRVGAAVRPCGRSHPHGRTRPQLRPAGVAGGAQHRPAGLTAALAPRRRRGHRGARRVADGCWTNTKHGLGA